MTRKQIEEQLTEIPSRIETMKMSNIAEYIEKGSKGTRELFEVIDEVYKRGIVDGRMWQQYLDAEKKANSKLLSLKEVSERLHVTYRTAIGYVESGSLPAKKTGRIWRIKEADLQEFIENR